MAITLLPVPGVDPGPGERRRPLPTEGVIFERLLWAQNQPFYSWRIAVTRLSALLLVEDAVRVGCSSEEAIDEAAHQYGTSASSIRRWRASVGGHLPEDWIWFLLPEKAQMPPSSDFVGYARRAIFNLHRSLKRPRK